MKPFSFQLLLTINLCQLLLTIDTGPTVHRKLNKREIKSVFGVDHHSNVPLYETTLIKKEGTEGHIRVQFQALNDQFRLKLWPNERLLSPEIMSIVRNGNGSKLHVGRLPVASDCHYVGEVQSHNGAPAALSGCNHLKGLVSMPDGFLLIHPLPARFTDENGNRPHVVFKRTASLSPFLPDFQLATKVQEDPKIQMNPMKEEDHFCDVNFDNVTLPKRAGAKVKRSKPPPLSFEFGNYSIPIGADNDDVPIYTGATPLTIEMGVFLDNKLWDHFVEEFGNDRAEQELVDFSLALINNVYVLYQQPSLTPKVDIVIVRFEIWKIQPEEMLASKHKNGHAQQILDKFCSYQAKLDPGTDTTSPEHWDHATLLTGFDLYHTSASVAGVAPVARMCDKPFSCSVVEGLHIGRSFVLAHEMGHNLGMVHDGVQNRCNSKCCLMSPINGAGKTTWSSCSVKEMNAYLNNLGTQGQAENCLADKPLLIARNHKTDGRLPGQRYTPDQQCAFFWGRDYKNEVPSGGALGEICNILWCGNGGSSISTAHPALDGSYCGDKQWCQQGLCTPWGRAEAPAPVVGSWSVWADLPHSQCSQCEIIGGLRVRRQLRICDNPAPNNGGPTCPGSEFRGSICSGSFDCTGYTKLEYGDRICASFRGDTKKGDGQLTGKSFPHPDSPCKLWCHLEGSDLIRNKAVFPDGTPCGNSQYCVNGKCLTFACNNKALVANKPDDCPDETGAAIWTRWSAWTSCSATCGFGVRNRQRSCQPDGRSCGGNSTSTESCKEVDCVSQWSQWTEWSSCSLTCGIGARSKNRTCVGEKCEGSSIETGTCGSDNCAQWADWAEWSACSATCGDSGKQIRLRSCKNSQNCPGASNEDRPCSSNQPCPTVALWSSWVEWSICSLTCGGGTRERNRQCLGGTCDGTNKEIGECNNAPCPTWSAWSEWNSCSATCDLGQRTKTRSCRGASAARFVILSSAALSQDSSVKPVENDCPGPSIHSENCNLAPCGDPNAFSAWQLWTTCSKSCGSGSRLRVRDCIAKGRCTGQSMESEACNSQPCNEGLWSQWSGWSACSSTCGEGRQDRPRFCLSEDSRMCRGFNKEERSCNSQPCGESQLISTAVAKTDLSTEVPSWSSWTQWSGCSCFSLQRVRRRYCNIRRPEQFGFCLGPVFEETDCQPVDCSPTAGIWSEWGDWSKCSESCSELKGEKVRYRVCANPYPINRGAYCHGKPYEMSSCTGAERSCSANPVSGGWSDWTDWTSCSVGCGAGTRSRTRYCNSPSTKNGGKPCSGVDFSMEDCVGSSANCGAPVDGEFGLWSEWSVCGAQCGFAFRNRSRLCNNPKPQNGGRRCRGLAFNTQVCPLPPCDTIDGQWNQWSGWSSCSVNCGFGQQTRTRICDNPTPQSGGIPCLGTSSETQSCTNGRLDCQNSLSNGEVLEDLVKNWESYRDLKPKRNV